MFRNQLDTAKYELSDMTRDLSKMMQDFHAGVVGKGKRGLCSATMDQV